MVETLGPCESLDFSSPVLDVLPVGLLLLDEAGQVLAANKTAERLLGVPVAEMHGRLAVRAALDVVRRDCFQLPLRDLDFTQILAEGRDRSAVEMALARADGSVAWINLRATPMPGGRIAVTLEDVGQRIRSTAVLEAHTRLVRQAEALDLAALLRATLDELEVLTGSSVGFYHFVDDDQETLHLQAWSTQTRGSHCRAQGQSRHRPVSQAGIWADAVRRAQPIIHNDFAAALGGKTLPEGHAPLTRELVVPVVRDGKVRAVAGVGNKARPYDEDDVVVMQRLADLSWELASLKLATQAAQQRTEQVQNIAASVPGLVCMLRHWPDGHWSLHHISAVSDEFYGLSVADLAQDAGPLITRFHPDDKAVLGETLAASARELSQYHVRWRYQHPDRGWRWYEVWAMPSRHPDGGVLWHGFITDVTAQVAAETAHVAALARLEESFEHAPTGIVLSGIDQKVIRANFSFCSLLGYGPEEIVGLDIMELTHPEDRAATMDARQALAATDTRSRRLEKRYLHRDGRLIWVQADISLLRDQAGHPLRFLTDVQDITDRRRWDMERALTVQVLEILNDTDEPKVTAARILTAIRTSLGVEAAAIRLAQDGDFVYVAYEGFPEAFIKAETCLRSRGPDGERLSDATGVPLLDCTCGRVLMGLVDPSEPNATAKGGIFVNRTSLEDLPASESDPRIHPRNRCVQDGYQSVALIPIRSGERMVGLLHLGDHRPNLFLPVQIAFLEGIASAIGLAIERKQMVEKLELSLRQLNLAHQATMSGYWTWDLQRNTVTWSDAFYALVGLSPGVVEASHAAWIDTIHSDDRAHVREAVERARAGGGDMDLEWRTVHPDGSVHWLLTRCHAERKPEGQALLYIGVTIDITARKAMEQVLRHNEERFRLLLDHAPAALAMFDRNMCYLAASRRWLDDYKLGDTPILGRSHYEVFPEIGAELRAIHQRALAGETVRADEDRFVRADDSVQWLRWEVLPWHTESGEVGGIVIFSEDITARRHAEIEKSASQAKLSAALESMTDAVFISDIEGWFIDFNEAFATFHKFPGKQACPRSFAEYPDILDVFFLDGTLARVEQWPVPRALRGEVATNAEYGLRRKDTGETWVGSYSFAPVRDEAGAIVGSVVVARDITEQKRAEQELRASEEKFQKIFNAAPVLMALNSLDTGEYLDVNQFFCEISGFSREEALGKDNAELGWIVEEAREQVLDLLQTRGRVTNLPITARAKDGRLVHNLYSGERIQLGEQGTLLSIALDVSETRKKEHALRQSEIRFRELFDHSPVALWEEDMSLVAERFAELRAQGVVDLRSHLEANPEQLRDLAARVRVLAVNAAGLKLFRANSVEELARGLPNYFDEQAMAVFREGIVALYLGKTKFESETPQLDAHGNRLDLQLRLSVLPAMTSHLARVLVSFTDLAARKTAEAERRELERELNHLQRLESLGRLASGVSHDMNNVLGIIMTLSSLLKSRHHQDAEICEDADLLMQAATRGRDLVAGLRDFSRKELRSATELDLNEVARREAELLEHTALKRVNILLDLTPDLPPILGEPGSIQNALMNLCVNAMDAMPNKGNLTLITRNLGQGFVELAVQDDGEGMAPDVLARALEPFFTTKPMGKGTGLGLSQVYGTVKAHSGTLDIASKPGVGTRVSMAFPSLPGLAPAEQTDEGELSPPARSLNVLLVDDEEMIRGAVVSLLEVLGHHAQAANSGLEALRRLEAGLQVDLVMLDINMPGMDGIETLSRLRMAHPQLKVLFATGFADERIPSILGRFPDVRIIKKPFSTPELARALSDW